MIDQRTVFEIHRLAHAGLSVRKIAKTLGISRQTTSKYLDDPHPQRPLLTRPSQLDPFKDAISRLLEIDPKVSAVVLRQRLAEQGFQGGITIVRDYLASVRPASTQKHAFIRFESAPGMQCQIDWGHFDAIAYGNTTRKLYCLGVVECYSRMLYLEFTHSQRQDTLHRCLLNAFRFFQGTPKEVVHDNMLTAVLERHGPLVRFNEQFLEFLRPFKITPIACNVAQPQEKGKVAKGAMHYIRHNFWPLRTFTNLQDLQAQANQWRDQVANVRVHTTTGQRPIDRFDPKAMRPLPEPLPDCRDTALAQVHTDFSIHFDGNTYTVPPWLLGKAITVKADHHRLTCYFKDKAVATHPRCWQRKQRIELPQHREAARKHPHRHWYSQEVAAFIALGDVAKTYLERLATTNQPLQKSVKRLLALKDD
jgi:transposase